MWDFAIFSWLVFCKNELFALLNLISDNIYSFK